MSEFTDESFSPEVESLLPLLKQWMRIAFEADEELSKLFSTKFGSASQDRRGGFTLKDAVLRFYRRYLEAGVSFFREFGAYTKD